MRASVIVPTYNRSRLLRRTLESLASQRCPADEFEVIVADDGSTDDTAAVVSELVGRLRIRRHFQPDCGYRLASVRNGGARLAAAPLLIFLDSGTLASPEFVSAHLEAHAGSRVSSAVAGYTYGYQPWRPSPGPGKQLDWRHEEFAAVDFDLDRRATPWLLFMGMNCSVRADDYWAAGGFDEDFQSWGVEDLELGYRLFQRGVAFLASRDAWAVEQPHQRDLAANLESAQANALLLLRKHPGPLMEITWRTFVDGGLWSVEPEYRALLGWIEQARGLGVRSELEQVARGANRSLAVFGCGPEVPAALESAILLDFDREFLDRAVQGGRHVGHHALGIRTPLPDGAVDTVVVTSRLRGLWRRWGKDVLAEAGRVGRSVLVTHPELSC